MIEKDKKTVMTELVLEWLDMSIGDRIVMNSFFVDLYVADFVKDKKIIFSFKNNNEMGYKITKEKYMGSLKSAVSECIDNGNLLEVEVLRRVNIDASSEVIVKSSSQNLNPQFTFDNYIKVGFNTSILEKVFFSMKNLGEFSPMFIYGKSGIGKTHLFHAIGNELDKESKRIIYIDSNKFVNDVVSYSQKRTKNTNLNKFTESFQQYDVLMFDDIQNLGSKEITMRILFNIINDATEKQKPIYIASDRPPFELQGFEDRLISRFEGGVTFSFEDPTYDDLEKILGKQIQSELGVDINSFEKEALKLIINSHNTSIRKLKSAVKHLRLHQMSVTEVEYTAEVIKRIFTDIKSNHEVITPQKIISGVAKYFKLSPKDLSKKSRKAEFVTARQMAMYLIKDIIQDITYEKIGKLFNRDHSTVMKSINKIEVNIKAKEAVKLSLRKLKKSLQN